MKPKPLKIKLVRDEFSASFTTGRLYVNGKPFCYTVEDVVRPKGEKVMHLTAIPSGKYKVVVNRSPKFGRMMPLIVNVPNFSGIRIHRGSTASASSGCILVGYQRNVRQGKLTNSADAELDLTNLILKSGNNATITIENRYVKRVFLVASLFATTLYLYYENEDFIQNQIQTIQKKIAP